jgi:hypothetical protein
MQTAEDKCAAIISLLGVAFLYRDQIPGAARTARQGWESERSQLDGAKPRFAPRPVSCSWKCWTCLAAHRSLGTRPVCPSEEVWMRECASLRRRYQIAEVEDTLYWLAEEDPTQAQAVWATYVEPWPDFAQGKTTTEPIKPEVRAVRTELAKAGVVWMAERLPEIRPFGPDTRDNDVRYWKGRGLSVRQIAQRIGESKSTVGRIVKALDKGVPKRLKSG